jgi:hypothetical protein
MNVLSEEKMDLSKYPPFFPKNRKMQMNENSQNINPNIQNQYKPQFAQKPMQQGYPQYAANYNCNMNNITNNMNNLNINYGVNPHYIDFPQPSHPVHIHNPGFQTSEAFYGYEPYNGFDSLNNSSSNISLEEGPNFFTLRPPPKKTLSDKNLKLTKTNSELGMKSLFKEKVEIGTEEINLAELLDDLNFDFPEYIKTQKGSRILQKELNTISPENLELLLERLCPDLTYIMVDTYGNYFSQRLIQCCSPQQRLQILKAVTKYFIILRL